MTWWRPVRAPVLTRTRAPRCGSGSASTRTPAWPGCHWPGRRWTSPVPGDPHRGILRPARSGRGLRAVPRAARSPRVPSAPGTGPGLLHRNEFEDLDGEPALALGQERVVLGERPGPVQAVGLHDAVAVLVARLRAGSVVADCGPGPERSPGIHQRGADPAHPVAPRLQLLGRLLGREAVHRRRRAAVQQQVLAHVWLLLEVRREQPGRVLPVAHPVARPI